MAFPRSIQDPLGRDVVLTAERWQHILDGHPELEAHIEDLVRAVQAPTQLDAGRERDEEWFYLRDAGPSR